MGALVASYSFTIPAELLPTTEVSVPGPIRYVPVRTLDARGAADAPDAAGAAALPDALGAADSPDASGAADLPEAEGSA